VTQLLSLSDARFVSLTTFRGSGERVSTPVWIGRDGDALVVLTPAGSGKVRRLRRDPRVELAPCGRFGKVETGVVPIPGTADVRETPDDVGRARATIRRHYPIESRLVLGIERLIERLRGRPRTERLALLIT
jgi:PPOX class probable F420-dependent enzyme